MKSNYVLPVTIVVAGLLIAGAVFWVGKTSVPTGTNNGDGASARAYDPAVDHILGNPNAQVKIVEYYDLECPHCKTFHMTMHQIMSFYGLNGNVAWVPRAFPLASNHSKAPQEAQAAECAAEQGGDAAYFKFVDKVFEVTPSNNGLDLAQLPVIAGQVGLNVEQFNSCLSSNKYAKKITDSYSEAIAAGGQGTPYILLMVNNELVPGGNLSGNQPYDSMRAAIDAMLSVLPGASASTTVQ
ncbi:thioredoxin domain-containing protein [Acetobacteraceae bacterium]|nr:thioredoxin domain-containing protein [Candidatus Parcubacteria bacterium]